MGGDSFVAIPVKLLAISRSEEHDMVTVVLEVWQPRDVNFKWCPWLGLNILGDIGRSVRLGARCGNMKFEFLRRVAVAVVGWVIFLGDLIAHLDRDLEAVNPFDDRHGDFLATNLQSDCDRLAMPCDGLAVCDCWRYQSVRFEG